MQAVGSTAELPPVEQIEQQLTVLVRRAQKVPLRDSSAEPAVERAAYGVLTWLDEAGPLRPSAVAAHFHLDASTISRQAAALERAGLVTREPDAEDRRACHLRLTELGQTVLSRTRSERRQVVRDVLTSWSPGDLAMFASLLAAFNADLDNHLTADPHTTGGNEQ